MKNKVVKSVFRYLLSVIVSVALLIAIKISMDGMYLLGIPKIDDVKQIRVSYPSVTEEIKEYDDSEKIDLAVKLTGFLKYSLFKQANDIENPLITIVYVLENGKEIEVSANNDTVWWNGKAHDIKDKEMFINLTKGIFFMEDLMNEK